MTQHQSSTPRTYPDNLLARHHEAKLAAGRIAPEVASVRGYRSATEKTTLARYHFADYQRRTPGLLIPIFPVVTNTISAAAPGGIQPFEFATYRPDVPRVTTGKAKKYEQAAGSRNCLDCLPSMREMLADPKIPLGITEGVLKEDSLTSAAIREGIAMVFISVQGTWNWRGRNVFDGLTTVADWEQIALNGRRVVLIFDSDAWRNPSVHAALRRLKVFLEVRGAIVAVVYLPDLADGTS
jgi:hypothetical protein